MLRSNRVTSCTLLLLILELLRSSGARQTHTAQEDAPEVGRADSQRALVLEAVKTGILSSLGMEREPVLTHKASEEELRKMYRLYRETLIQMRGNSSNMIEETQESNMSTVLFPATVKLSKVNIRSGRRVRWYRAVFHRNSIIQAEVSLARAELKVSRQILHKPTPAHPQLRPTIKAKINGKRLVSSLKHTNMSNTDTDLIVDVSEEVETWMTSDGGHALVVHVGMVVVGDSHETNPTVSLELGLKPSRKPRQRRLNKEDDCDERGWCCRKSITVSFKDIEWSDWVVAPTEYTMHFCDGTCPHNYKPASMHTQVKARMHHITKGGTPRPCCVPASYEPLVLMHYDARGALKLTAFSDLIVSKCHCA